MRGLRLVPGETTTTVDFPDGMVRGSRSQPGYTVLIKDNNGYAPMRSLSVFRFRLPDPRPIGGRDRSEDYGSAESL